MQDFRSRKNNYPFIYSSLFLVISIIFLAILVVSTFSSYQKKNTAQQEQEKYDQRHQELLEKKQLLTDKIETLRTDEGKKEELRKTYNVGEEGESVLHIVETRE